MRVVIVALLLMRAAEARADAPSGYQCNPGTSKVGEGCTCPAGFASKRADENVAICAVVAKPSEATVIKQECSRTDAALIRALGTNLSPDELTTFRPALRELAVQRCVTDPWSRDARKCFAAARTEEAAYECLEMLAPVHRTSLEAEAARLIPLGVTVTKTELKLRAPIVFGVSIARMSDRSRPLLDSVAATMKANPTIRIEIQTHTDNTGGDNQRLSQSRAESMRTYLIGAGIAGERLVAKGFGETMPIASNKTAWGRASNRRVQLVRLPDAAPTPATAPPATTPPATPKSGADRDGDTIANGVDRCPDEPETFNGTDDEDGCPDRGRVVVTGTSLEILDAIYFEFNKDVIKPQSLPILDAVAATLKGTPAIELVEIQGHTDARGDDQYNLKLSDDRAKSVAKYLVGKGIDAARLTALGYGETLPIDRGNNEGAYAKNRRIAFLILKRR
jgi:outer membrane protein OmpA-like peptidoglycan-associated protein